MRTPRLTRKLRLEYPDRVPDAAGGYQTSWVLLGTLWGSVKPGTGRETEESGLSLSAVPYRIHVRAAPPQAPSRPRPGQRFRDGDRIYSILSVTEADGDARYLTCVAREEEVPA